MRRSLPAASRLLHTLLLGVAALYCLVIVALSALWLVGPEQRWWIAVTNIFALYLFAPLLLLAPLAVVVRSGWLRALVTAPLLIFLAWFGPTLLPASNAAPAGASLRVVSFNQRATTGRAADILDAVRAQQADVVALQEVTPDVMHRATTQLRDIYPYQEHVTNEWDLDLSLLSRYPMQVHALDPEVRRLRVTLDVNGAAVELINVHLNSPDYGAFRPSFLPGVTLPRGYSAVRREREAALLLTEIDSIGGPLIVLGDHNTSEREPLYRQFAARLTDAYRSTSWGPGATYPSNRAYFGLRLPFPLVRIDYVWTRAGVAASATDILCNVARSDHCMLIADLRLEG